MELSSTKHLVFGFIFHQFSWFNISLGKNTMTHFFLVDFTFYIFCWFQQGLLKCLDKNTFEEWGMLGIGDTLKKKNNNKVAFKILNAHLSHRFGV